MGQSKYSYIAREGWDNRNTVTSRGRDGTIGIQSRGSDGTIEIQSLPEGGMGQSKYSHEGGRDGTIGAAIIYFHWKNIEKGRIEKIAFCSGYRVYFFFFFLFLNFEISIRCL